MALAEILKRRINSPVTKMQQRVGAGSVELVRRTVRDFININTGPRPWGLSTQEYHSADWP